MLAIIKATEAWRHYLEATPYVFKIHTVTIPSNYHFTDNCFVLRITLADAMCSMDVSMSRVPARLFVCFPSRVTCFGPCTCMFPVPFHVSLHFTVLDSRLVCAYCFVLCLPLSVSRLVCRVVIPRTLTHSSPDSSSIFFVCLYLYLADHYIYGWGWGLVPHLQSTLQPP